jgi:PEP-CTERM motif
MRKSLLITIAAAGLALFAGQASAAYLALDACDYGPVGSPLSGHDGWGLITNAAGSPDPTIASGSLSHPDRLPNPGNSAQLTGTGASGNSKLPLKSLQTTGTVYYSMLVEVSDISNLNDTANGSFFAGFQPHNNISPAVSSVATGGGNLLIHRDADNPSAYNLGVSATAGGNTGDREFDTTEFLQGDTVFVVVAYQMNPDVNDDQAFLWLNPDPLTYGALVAPLPDVTSNGADTAANDHGPVSSFYLRNNGVEPDFTLVDDLRVAATWDEVTRLVIPEPSAIALAGLALLGLLQRRRK